MTSRRLFFADLDIWLSFSCCHANSKYREIPGKAGKKQTKVAQASIIQADDIFTQQQQWIDYPSRGSSQIHWPDAGVATLLDERRKMRPLGRRFWCYMCCRVYGSVMKVLKTGLYRLAPHNHGNRYRTFEQFGERCTTHHMPLYPFNPN